MKGERRWSATIATAAALALVPLAGVLPAATATTTIAPAVYGGGSGPFEADRVHIALNARGQGLAAKGTFVIVHQTPDGIFAFLTGQVDCLVVNGGNAIATGTITAGFDGLGIDPVGHRVSLAVHDINPDIVEMDVSFVSGHTIAPCSSTEILVIPFDRGGLRVA